MGRNNWTKSELLIALKVYCELKFGQFHKHHTRIIEVSAAIDRTPSALAMKLCNFASLDPAMEGKGLKSASNADKKIMGVFLESPEHVILEAELEYEKLDFGKYHTGLSEPEVIFEYDYEKFPETENLSVVKTRILQNFFRKTVVSSYGFSCAICGTNIPNLLIASHIVPWARNKKLRLMPTNGISLCASHDKAFDKGYLSLEENYKIILSERLNDYDDNYFVKLMFFDFAGKTIIRPFRFLPDKECLEWHRENVFLN
jgi:putative restriction endonuclease